MDPSRIDEPAGTHLAPNALLTEAFEAELRALDASDHAAGLRRWAQLRPRHVGAALLVLPLVIALALALSSLPGLSVGWTSLLGGGGSIAFGGGATQTDAGGGLLGPLLALLIAAGLVWLMPRAAEGEELAFRAGDETRSWPRRLLTCTRFGLLHLIMGIPLGAGIALILAGLYFTGCYHLGRRRRARLIEAWRARWEGTEDPDSLLARTLQREERLLTAGGVATATRFHLAYNGVILGVFIAATLVELLV